ncbi:hypothetical protein DSL72_004032 [Monilinia vaccinii-corymbosi]|uniref:Uncharacterized protein n=1 Tax=Monilinia vaccinii-corymbosi TaxID=61207 RepID=A0A8A3P6U4_9HELO|nr:hypothetical protein DSL72_004032 [Monilinia vaccinii-corymbosi]
MEPYKTQQDLMVKKAQEKGIQISEVTEHFRRKLSQAYENNPHFPDDSWPGTTPDITPSTVQVPLKPETMSPESGEITELPDEKDDQPSLPGKPKPALSLRIEEVLLTAAGNPKY